MIVGKYVPLNATMDISDSPPLFLLMIYPIIGITDVLPLHYSCTPSEYYATTINEVTGVGVAAAYADIKADLALSPLEFNAVIAIV